MSSKPIRAVVFDAVGTVIHPEPPAVAVYADVGRRFGSRIDGATLKQGFAAAFAKQEQLDRAAGWRTSEARELERWRSIVSEVLFDVTDANNCFAVLFDHFSQTANWRCDPAVAELLATLRSRGCQLALASNFDGRLRQVVAGLPALAPLTQIVISSEVGWRKPAREFFAAVCRAVDVEASEILYVGDDLANDVQGATAAGCQAVLYDPSGCNPYSVPTIQDLRAVSGFALAPASSKTPSLLAQI